MRARYPDLDPPQDKDAPGPVPRPVCDAPPLPETQHKPPPPPPPPQESGDCEVKKEKGYEDSAPYDPFSDSKFDTDDDDVEMEGLASGGQNTQYATYEDISHLR